MKNETLNEGGHETMAALIFSKLKAYIDRNSYSYYIDENTGELFAVNNAGGTSPDLKMDETSGDIYYLI